MISKTKTTGPKSLVKMKMMMSLDVTVRIVAVSIRRLLMHLHDS